MNPRQEIRKVTSVKELILLYNKYAKHFQAKPKQQLECFSVFVGNPYENPKVFETLIKFLDKILETNIELLDTVLLLLHKVLQTKHANVENCDFMIDMLNAKKHYMSKFDAGKINVFVKNVKLYRQAMQKLEDVLEAEKPMSKPKKETMYGVSRPTQVATTKYGVTRPRIEPMYGVSRPTQTATTKYGVTRPGTNNVILRKKSKGNNY